MSGKRNHFLPRFLQKPFSHKKGEGNWVWQYRRTQDGGAKCDEASIRDVGVADRFYGNVDPLLTDLEIEYLPLHAELLEAKLGLIQNASIPVFLTHLEVRSVAVRRFGEIAARKMQDAMLTEGRIRSGFSVWLRARGEPVNEGALAEYVRNQMPEVRRKIASRAPLLDKKAQGWHNKTIETCPLPTGKIEQYSDFQYDVVSNGDGEPFVLGDGAIFFRHGERISGISYPFLTVEEVWLPLSPSRCLIGLRGKSRSSIAKVPEYAASTASQFFISGFNTQAGLGRHIATKDAKAVEMLIAAMGM